MLSLASTQFSLSYGFFPRVSRSRLRYRRHMLADCLVANAAPEQREQLARIPGLEQQLREGVAKACETWPTLSAGLNGLELVGYLASRLRGDSAVAMARVQYSDLLLASACAAGNSDAIQAFQTHFQADIARAIARFTGPGLAADDLRQSLLERLFVASANRAPRISEYGGQGYLQNWLRVTAVRLFVDLLRKAKQSRSVLGVKATALDEMEAPDNLELQLVRKRYQREFKAGFENALASLAPEERNLLRWRHIHGVGVNEIAAMLRIHRVTATQRLKRIRHSLQNATLAHVQSSLNLNDESLDGFIRVIQSSMDASVSRILGSMEAEPKDREALA